MADRLMCITQCAKVCDTQVLWCFVLFVVDWCALRRKRIYRDIAFAMLREVEVFVFSSVGVRFDGSYCPVIVLSQGSAPHPAKEG